MSVGSQQYLGMLRFFLTMSAFPNRTLKIGSNFFCTISFIFFFSLSKLHKGRNFPILVFYSGLNWKMLMGHAEGAPRLSSSTRLLLSDPESESDGDEEADTPERILFLASFDELGAKCVQYDTIIWLSISLLLVLAWGIGILMLLYLPIRRYVLKKEISSRKLYVTPDEIVYKVSRPSFIPFWKDIKFEKHVPLSLVIDIIIEQGSLQSRFGLHTFRVESIARGKAAPVDELQVQGVHNPGLLRKVIVDEASKVIHVGRSWRPVVQGSDGAPAVLRSPSKTSRLTGSPPHASPEHRGFVPSDFLLHKLDEANKSVKKIELLIEKSSATPGSTASRV